MTKCWEHWKWSLYKMWKKTRFKKKSVDAVCAYQDLDVLDSAPYAPQQVVNTNYNVFYHNSQIYKIILFLK